MTEVAYNNKKIMIKRSKKLYINTLEPYFEFRNKEGKTVKPRNCCINMS